MRQSTENCVPELPGPDDCVVCGFSLEKPKNWREPYWFTIRTGIGTVHDWCWSRCPGSGLQRIEIYAAAAWEAGL